MEKRVAAVVGGKHVTAKMLDTLRAIQREPVPLSAMQPNEVNRFHALRDKGLATIARGVAGPTAAGSELLRRKA